MESSSLVKSLSGRGRSASPKASLYLAGFTLIEMLVVLSLIVVITSVVLVGQNGFNKSILLTDTAYTLALSIRQAQSFGLSSRTFTNKVTSISYNDTGFGVHLDSSTPTSYTFFADVYPSVGTPINNSICPNHGITDPSDPEARPGNCLYDGPSQGESVQTYAFSRGFSIQSFCGYVGTGSNATAYCSNGGATPLQALDIVFIRPNTSSIMTGVISNEFSGSPSLVNTNFSTACIRVRTPDGSASQYVKVSQLGQVSVSASCSP